MALRRSSRRKKMKPYSSPDITEWLEDDPRRQMDAFDEEFLREQYNNWMPREKPQVPSCKLPFNKMGKLFAPHIAERGGKALDIGCANAELLIALMQKQFIDSGVGIDISDAMIENAISSAENNDVKLSFERAAIENYRPATEYDVVIATEVLEHIFNLRQALRRIISLLVDDGVFCGNVPLRKVCDAIVHLHYFTSTSLSDLLNDFFAEVLVIPLDITGEGEMHLVFICKQPKKGNDE